MSKNILTRMVGFVAILLSGQFAWAQAEMPAVADRAKALWSAVGPTPYAVAANSHVAIVVPKAQEKRAQEYLGIAEKYRQAAAKAAGYASENPWPIPLVVLVLPGKDEFGIYVRRVQKRSLESGETSSIAIGDEQLHAGLWLRPGKTMAPADMQVGELVAAAVAAKRIGVKNPSPDWISDGFGRATSHKLSLQPFRAFLTADKRRANAACKTLTTQPWSESTAGDEAEPARNSLMYLLAYGTFSEKFPAFLGAFIPEENQEKVEVEAAMTKAGVKADSAWSTWKSWAVSWR
jgi:hypothetical protein